jgi:hypothetical protein
MQGAFLTGTSLQTRTSVVKRGRFVREHLLCTSIPAPPPGIAPLPMLDPNVPRTQRDVLSQHVASPTCGGCHNIIDPPGFALEPFDALGASRSTDEGLPIDASGTLGGHAFDGPTQLAALIADDPAFVSCVARQLYSYALGRSLVAADNAALADIVKRLHDQGDRLDVLIDLIVASPAFSGVPAPGVSP